MVGRAAERDTLTRILGEACAGRGRALLVRGEAGVGKSMLLHRTAEDAGDRDMRVLHCSGVESEVEQAFSGLHQLLGPVLGHLPDLPEAQAGALRGALGLTDAAATDLQVSAATLALLAAAARERPLLVAADDVQWLDRATARTLVFAARRLSGEPIAVLLAARAGEASTVDTSDLPALQLGGLAPPEAARLLAERGWEIPGHLRDTVLAATGGNPLALTELAAFGDPDRLLADLALTGTVPVGDRLRGAFLRRITALPADSRDVLLVAAAEETGSTEAVVGAAARQGVSSSALDAAERAGLVHVTGTAIRFHHPLVRSVAYHDASFARRRAAHEAIAAELTANSAADQAAWHRAVVATGPDEKLASALERSANAARRRGGEAAAATVLRRAAGLSESAEGRRDRTVAAAFVALDSGQPDVARTLAEEVLADPAPEVTLAQLTGNIELYSGDPAVAYEHLLRCGELLAASDPEEAAWALVQAASAAFRSGDMEALVAAVRRIDALDCAPTTRRVGRYVIEGGELTAAQLWELPEALARTQPEGGGRPWMWATVVGWRSPDLAQARLLAEATGRRLHSIGATAQLPELHYYLADIEFWLGQWDSGTEHAEEGLRFTRETGQRTWTANHLALLARFAAGRGDTRSCRQYAEQALEIAAPLRERAAAGMATAALGLLALGEGDAEQACRHLARLVTPGSPYAHPPTALSSISEIVEASVRAQRPELGRGALEGFEAWFGSTHSRSQLASLHHCRALLAGDAGEGGDAGDGWEAPEQHFRRALEVGEVADRPFHRGRTALFYGEWLRRNRRRADARVQLRTAADAFGSAGAEPWARRARAELRATGERAQRARSAATELLSAQELEVARLAAQGLSNREIGERLVLSPRTVGSHLYRMFPKLEISTRSQLRDLDLG
ncbi:ATP-binding protein [Lipingzhangella halophila]|nr:LuxR family transcriptional regulator [Lipingzhangella halophila]